MSQPVSDSLLYLDGVTVRFDGFRALNDLSLVIEPGEMRAIIGPNGAGKTTMMDVITGKTRPDQGAVLFDGRSDLTLLDEAAIAELGFSGVQGEDMVVVENTPTRHNMVVCTLCSCYPWPTLGLPPNWYKSAPYRARAVSDPRGVLEEFGVELAEDVEVRVWDSNAELRYLVLPQRPAGTDGLSEEELAALVTRDSMIGTGLAASP